MPGCVVDPSSGWETGAVVSWSTRRASGFGQVLGVDADGLVLVRPFLPTRSSTVRCSPVLVQPLFELGAFMAMLDAADRAFEVSS